MARYDSPGFLDHLPGFRPANSFDQGQTAGGSEVDEPARPTETVMTGLPGVGTVFGQRNPAGADSDLQPGQGPALDDMPFTGGDGAWHAPDGHANHFTHPNSGGLNDE